MNAKYAELLKDKDVKRWFENLAAKSYVTATVYLRTLGLYCELNKTSPKALLKTARTKAFRDSFADFVRRMEKEGRPDRTSQGSRRQSARGSATTA